MAQDSPADGLEQEDHSTEQSDEQRMAAFEAGLAGKRTTETPSEPVEQPSQETASAPAAETPPAPRIRQLTEDEYSELTAKASRVDTIDEERKRDRDAIYGTIGGLQRSINQRRAISLPQEKLDALRADLPEVAELLEAMAKATEVPAFDPDSVARTVEEKLKPSQDQLIAAAEQRAWRRLSAERLAETHENWQDDANSTEFAAFVKAQGDEYMNKLAKASEEWDYRVIGAALSKWKDSKKAADDDAAARRERLNSNVNPRGSSPMSAPPPSRDEAFTAGLRKVGAAR